MEMVPNRRGGPVWPPKVAGAHAGAPLRIGMRTGIFIGGIKTPRIAKMIRLQRDGSGLHVLSDGGSELRGFQLGSTLHVPLEVVGHALLRNCLFEGGDDDFSRLLPADVVEQHDAGENQRSGIHDIEACIFWSGSMGCLEETYPVADIGAGRDPQAAHLSGAGIREIITVEIRS